MEKRYGQEKHERRLISPAGRMFDREWEIKGQLVG